MRPIPSQTAQADNKNTEMLQNKQYLNRDKEVWAPHSPKHVSPSAFIELGRFPFVQDLSWTFRVDFVGIGRYYFVSRAGIAFIDTASTMCITAAAVIWKSLGKLLALKNDLFSQMNLLTPKL